MLQLRQSVENELNKLNRFLDKHQWAIAEFVLLLQYCTVHSARQCIRFKMSHVISAVCLGNWERWVCYKRGALCLDLSWIFRIYFTIQPTIFYERNEQTCPRKPPNQHEILLMGSYGWWGISQGSLSIKTHNAHSGPLMKYRMNDYRSIPTKIVCYFGDIAYWMRRAKRKLEEEEEWDKGYKPKINYSKTKPVDWHRWG